MDAHQLFKAGNLAAAIDAQIPVVKAKPADAVERLFLFELLAFAGELDRAQRQIDAISSEDPQIQVGYQLYRRLLDAERTRRQVFAAKAQPGYFTPPPDHVTLRLTGLTKLTGGAVAEGVALFQEANAGLGPLRGSLNGQPFAGLRDGDDRLGSVLEVLANGNYFWVPLEQVAAISSKAPRFPRDLIWLPAQLDMHSGVSGQVFLPTLYPQTDLESDAQLKLGRLTDWRAVGEGESLMRGVGLKTFLLGDEATSILDWRKLELSSP